ncbi:UBX domain-containing protein 1 [Euwallacea fornicatus]|uniref:UBX domain-containing protein 1 n=1 Tax=Euwallacea fornicatus TaxID=995702 RepID=UPI00338FC986
MSSVIGTLIDMGFPQRKVELAVQKTGSQNVQIVMEWMLSHEAELDSLVPSESENVPSIQENSATSSTTNSSSLDPAIVTAEGSGLESSIAPPVSKSIKCDDCGKLFKTNDEVEFHASKTGHDNYSESTEEKTPLTEEEKKEQLAKIEAKLKQRRMERELREKEEARLREKNRIKSGKDMLEAKKKHEELEMKKIVEQRRREKEDERKARQRVKEQIEADKLARKAKFGGAPAQEQSVPEKLPPAPVEKKPPTNYSEVKLQIRLIDGRTLVQNFGAKEPLSAVRLYVDMNRTEGEGPFKLMTSFPKKIFTSEDYDKPLDTLGLAPAATLIVSKS